MKLKYSDIARIRSEIQEKQGNLCAICSCHFKEGYYHHKKKKVIRKHTPVLDHCHKTGNIRGVLCSGCNSLEGKLINAIERWHTSVDISDKTQVVHLLYGLAKYYQVHEENNTGYAHPLFKTDEEKRCLKNKRARLKRKSK